MIDKYIASEERFSNYKNVKLPKNSHNSNTLGSSNKNETSPIANNRVDNQVDLRNNSKPHNNKLKEPQIDSSNLSQQIGQNNSKIDQNEDEWEEEEFEDSDYVIENNINNIDYNREIKEDDEDLEYSKNDIQKKESYKSLNISKFDKQDANNNNFNITNPNNQSNISEVNKNYYSPSYNRQVLKTN